jgi:hypothetical protein
MERMWQERADYGHFFYRIPNGESAADAYDRVSGFNESLWRLFGEDDFASVCILVTHGLMTRVFLMKWYHFSVEYFEDLRNVNHCEFVVMKKNQSNGRYILQNQLRTWSELRRERQASLAKNQSQLSLKELSSSPIPVRKKWGGCPDGCTHGQMKYQTGKPQRKNTVDLFKDDDEPDPLSQPGQKPKEIMALQSDAKAQVNLIRDTYPPRDSDEDTPHESTDHAKNPFDNVETSDITLKTTQLQIDDIVSSAAGTPVYISMASSRSQQSTLSPRNFNFLAGGRDGGGSRSGAASPLSVEEDGEVMGVNQEEEQDEAMPLPSEPPKVKPKEWDGTIPEVNDKAGTAQRRAWGSLAKALNGGFAPDGTGREVAGMSHRAMADALGDQSDVGSDGGDHHDELIEEEKEDKSLWGSVY